MMMMMLIGMWMSDDHDFHSDGHRQYSHYVIHDCRLRCNFPDDKIDDDGESIGMMLALEVNRGATVAEAAAAAAAGFTQ